MIPDVFGRRFFSMYDPDPKKFGLVELLDDAELEAKNKNQFGVFWTVNKIRENLPRKKENVEKILALAFEVDEGSKEEQAINIKKNVTPSMIIETKRGYHCYFFVEDFEPDADKYREFVLDRIVPFYGADKNAADATRILRVPTFYHWKDIENPYLVKVAHLNETTTYTTKKLEKLFPILKTKEVMQRNNLKNELSFQKDGNLFMKIYNSNQGELLRRLSGTEAVGMETIDFKRSKNNTYAIVVNGKSTSSWIDANGKIGSTDNGGPTIWQWVNWYQKDHKRTYTLLKKCLPEVFDEQL